MYRYKTIIQYDGSYINGWTGDTNNEKSIFVKNLLIEAIFKYTGENVNIICAGRTDAGVHAIGQVCHFDLNKKYAIYSITNGINYFLKTYVRILSIEIVDFTFDARFSAKSRTYEYLIYNGNFIPPLLINKCLLIRKKLNFEKMQEFISFLPGEKDFSIFYPTKYTGKRIRNINYATIEKKEIFNICVFSIIINAKSFAHHQVRNIIGCLIKVGLEIWSFENFLERFATYDRCKGGDTVDPSGLFLLKVEY